MGVGGGHRYRHKELMLESGPAFINGLGFSPDSTQLLVITTCGDSDSDSVM
jgi:hypothetical protein